MFKNVNQIFDNMKSDEQNNKFIVESVVGDELLPFSDDEDESLVDSDSLDPKIIDKIDELLDKIINSEDYDDSDIDDLVDDDENAEIDNLIDSSDVQID